MNSAVLPSFTEALRFWFKLGWISFGGPAGQIALMHQELVDRRRWIDEPRYLHALNYCILLPGPEAQQLATYMGWLMHGTKGGIAAGALFVLPSLVVICVLTWMYLSFGNVIWVAGMFYAVKPAVAAIVLHAAHRIGRRSLKHPALWLLAAAAFGAIAVAKVPFPAVIAIAAVLGLIGGRLRPVWFSTAAAHPSAPASSVSAAAPVGRAKPLLYALVGLALWGVPLGLLVYAYGWFGDPTQMGWFFTNAALLTFGGAYAVLPYVFQGAVERYAWVNAAQMMDGLALGETTPGPLIMIVAFVGFAGGWKLPEIAGGDALLAAVMCASVATYFTFLPSFLFILIGAPIVEATHGKLAIAAPLAAIGAAVVGVVASLVVFFAQHTLWPSTRGGDLDLLALGLLLLALVLLFRTKLGIIWTVGVFAGIGLVLALLGFTVG